MPGISLQYQQWPKILDSGRQVVLIIALFVQYLPYVQTSHPKRVDIAIIGAGAAGTYAAWKLSQRYPEKSIHLFETTNRIGGRLYSVAIPGIKDYKAELGAMRYKKNDHYRVHQAIEELGLEVMNFTTPTPGETLHYLRGKHLLPHDLIGGYLPYIVSPEDQSLKGRQNRLIGYLYYLDKKAPYFTLKMGMDALAKQMAERFLQTNKRRNKMYLQHELVKIDSTSTDIVLQFKEKAAGQMINIIAEDVVLTMAQKGLQQIEWEDIENIPNMKYIYDSVTGGRALKIYLAYDKPWWRDGGYGEVFTQIRASGKQLKYITTDLPVRMVLDIGQDETTGKSLLLVYNDSHQNFNYWMQSLQRSQTDTSAISAELTPTKEMILIIGKYLSRVLNIPNDKIPKPYASMVQAWHGSPYHGSWHYWNTGYNHTRVQDVMLKPLCDRNVFIIGETYSSIHSWIEGALERTEAMIDKYF